MMAILFIIQSTIVLGVFYYSFLGNLVAGNAPLLFASEDMLIINGFVTAIIGTYVLRKLGNPILAIRRALHEIGDGNLSVRLRTGDNREFNELCVALNRALEQVNGKISEARELTKVLDTLDDQPSPDEKTVLKAMEDCRDVLKYFDVDKEAGNDASDSVSRSQQNR